MLTVKDLTELENYIRSGELEADFKERLRKRPLLPARVLEKLMDVSELADAAATRLIFKGLPVPPPPTEK